MDPLSVSVALHRRSYFPGEIVKILVKAQTADGAAGDADSSSSAVQLSVECFGQERVDPGWVNNLYQPHVPAQKDTKRLVRTVFSTGKLQLLDGDKWQPGTMKAYAVRLRLPTRIPPSFKGSAVHFLYQVVVKGTVAGPSSGGKPVAVQATCPFLVWPKAERTGAGGAAGIDGRRASMGLSGAMPLSPTPAGALAAAGSMGAQAAAFAAAAAAGESLDHQPEPDLLEYRLGVKDVRAKWEEVAVAADGSLQQLSRGGQPQGDPQQQQDQQQQQQQQLEQQQGLEQQAPAGSGSLDAGGLAEAEADDGLREEPAHSMAGGGRLTMQQRASMVPRTYNLRAGDHPLVRVTLQPPMDAPLQPGATLGVFLDLRAAHGPAADPAVQPTCLQVVALLQSEEEVFLPYAHKPAKGAASDAGAVCAMRTLYAEQQQTTANLLTSQFLFSVPPNAHPSFRTPLAAHRWALRFELTLGLPPRGGGGGGGGVAKRATEQLVWSLPLVVCPPCS